MKPIVSNYRYVLERRVIKYPNIRVLDNNDICAVFKLKERAHIDSIRIIRQKIIYNKQFRVADLGPIEWNSVISYR